MIDGNLIVEDPLKTLKEKSSESYRLFANLDYMTGTTNAEACAYVAYLVHSPIVRKRYQAINWVRQLAGTLGIKSTIHERQVANELQQVYFDDRRLDFLFPMQSIVYSVGDQMFLAPQMELLRHRQPSSGKPTRRELLCQDTTSSKY